jgi:pimeloyl-ACP methyl ester carboxylesterase
MSEPLILLHGLGSFRHAWKPVVPLLAGEFEVVPLDLPGFGDAPVLDGGVEPTPQALARFVAGVLDERGWDTAHVAGNSLGGWVALELAKLGRTRSVCAVSPAGFWDGWERTWMAATLRVTRAAAAAGASQAEAVYGRAWARRLVYAQMTAHGERMPAGEAVAASRNLASSPGWGATLRAMTPRSFSGAEAVPPPVTVAWGERDRLLLRTPQAARARAALPHARHIVLAGCGHVPMWDDPEQVAQAIRTSV